MKTQLRTNLLTSVLCFFAMTFACAGLTTAQSIYHRNGKIAFVSNRDGNPEIYVMNADGTDHVRLTFNPYIDDHPTWSPDGTKLAFLSQKAPGQFVMMQMNADGSGKTEIRYRFDRLVFQVNDNLTSADLVAVERFTENYEGNAN